MRSIQSIRANVRKDWYQISAKADEAAQVLIYGEIGDSWWDDSVPASKFVRDLAAIDASAIDFHIHSPGGDVFDGLAIATAIRTHPAKTTAYVDGLAASAASIIAIAADETVVALGAEMMVHDAWGFAMGNAADMSKMAADLDHISGNLAGLYAAKAGGTSDEWRDVMRAETWYSATEAVEAGLANRVGSEPEAKAKAAFDLSMFKNAGRENAPRPTFPGRPRAMNPPAPPVETNPTKGAGMPDLNSGVRAALGIPADVNLDEDGILAALAQRLAQPAPIPAGTVLMDAAALESLQVSASQGAQAWAAQVSAHRQGLVNAAIQDGKIPPARRDHWLAQLEADPEGAETTLDGLAKGLIPLEAKGYTGGVTESSDDDAIYSALFGKEA